MDRNVGVAAKLSQSDREELAILALARSEPISDLAVQHGVSRKFVYAQKHKARCALDEAFVSAATDDTVLFQIPVTKRWLRQVIVALALMCRGSYLGILEFMRDVLGWPIRAWWSTSRTRRCPGRSSTGAAPPPVSCGNIPDRRR